MGDRLLANLIGALSLRLADQQAGAVEQAGGLGLTACAALSALGQHVRPLSVKELASVCGVSHSVMVRMVADLVDEGLVERLSGDDRRMVLVSLTDQGSIRRHEILEGRNDALADVLNVLDDAEKQALLTLAGSLLAALPKDDQDIERVCRLCDHVACGVECPLENGTT